MIKKQKHKEKLLKYLSNPGNDFLSRKELATDVLGFSSVQSIHNAFTAIELQEIEEEALYVRRRVYSGALSRIDLALIKRAESGDVKAIELAYKKFEDWNQSKKIDHGLNDSLKSFLEEIDGESAKEPNNNNTSE